MEFFMLNPNKSLTTEEIFNHIWKDTDQTADVVWLYVSYLRNKLKSISADIFIEGEKDGSFILTSEA